MNILITGHDTFENKGCQALVYTQVEMLNRALPGAKFKVFSWDPDYDRPRFQRQGIDCEFIQHRFQTGEFSSRNQFWLFLRNQVGVKTDRILRVAHYFYDALNWADLVVVSGGDILGDYGEAAVKHYFFPVAVAQALDKPVYIFAQSISRYKDIKLQSFCKRYLDKAALITVRERISFEYLKELGVKAPYYKTADPAFTLDVCSDEEVESIASEWHLPLDGKPVVGFSVSRTVTRWGGGDGEQFISVVAEAIDRLAERYPDAQFIFVPHVICRNDPGNDDRLVGKEIYEATKRKSQVHLIEGDYTCEELKGIIGKCDVFVGARTHATIASSSQAVPTLAIAYSTKAYGIMEDVLDRDKCVVDIKDINSERLTSMIEYLVENRNIVSEEMKKRMANIRQSSLQNGELARELFG